MSNYETKPGNGTIWRNLIKTEGSNQPDYDGKIKLLTGEEMKIALWVKDGQNGKFFSAKLSEPMKKADTPTTGASHATKVESAAGSSDLPF